MIMKKIMKKNKEKKTTIQEEIENDNKSHGSNFLNPSFNTISNT